jgi:hypothetical protein
VESDQTMLEMVPKETSTNTPAINPKQDNGYTASECYNHTNQVENPIHHNSQDIHNMIESESHSSQSNSKLKVLSGHAITYDCHNRLK